jgi:hypothetical protein
MLSLCAAAALAACSDQAATDAEPKVDKATDAKTPRPAYCFFKDSETKGWVASRDAQGNVVVKGSAFRSDPRYKAELGAPEVSGAEAVVRPSIAPNTTGFASPGNWWDVSATIPGSAAVEKVTVRCGSKVLAELPVKRSG